MATTQTPSFEILQAAALKTCFDVMNDSFEPQEEGKSLGAIFNENINVVGGGDILATINVSSPPGTTKNGANDDNNSNNNNNKIIQRVVIGCGTEWIKCACGSVNIGIRLLEKSVVEQQERLSTENKNKRRKAKEEGGEGDKNDDTTASTATTIFVNLFGGTDSDRNHAGDTFFWEAVLKDAPSITAEQWTEFCTPENVPGMIVAVKEEEDDEEEEDEEEEDEDWCPQTKFPDVFHSTLILALADKLLDRVVSRTVGAEEEASSWQYEGPCNEIEYEGNKLQGHAWILRRSDDNMPAKKAKTN